MCAALPRWRPAALPRQRGHSAAVQQLLLAAGWAGLVGVDGAPLLHAFAGGGCHGGRCAATGTACTACVSGCRLAVLRQGVCAGAGGFAPGLLGPGLHLQLPVITPLLPLALLAAGLLMFISNNWLPSLPANDNVKQFTTSALFAANALKMSQDSCDIICAEEQLTLLLPQLHAAALTQAEQKDILQALLDASNIADDSKVTLYKQAVKQLQAGPDSSKTAAASVGAGAGTGVLERAPAAPGRCRLGLCLRSAG